MTRQDVKNLKAGGFKRLCGVTREIFAVVCEVSREYEEGNKRGGKSNFSIENLQDFGRTPPASSKAIWVEI